MKIIVSKHVASLILLLWNSGEATAFQFPQGKSSSATNNNSVDRRQMISTLVPSTAAATTLIFAPQLASAEEMVTAAEPVQVQVTGEVKKLFNEGRALESQGNMAAAQRIYGKVTKLAPRVSPIDYIDSRLLYIIQFPF